MEATYPGQRHGGYICDSISFCEVSHVKALSFKSMSHSIAGFLPGEALIFAEGVGHIPISVLICCWKSKSHDCLKVR